MEEVAVILAAPYAEAIGSVKANGPPTFAYYTDASTASSILQNSEIWMRNASLMNDHSEIAYGIERIIASFKKETTFGSALSDAGERLGHDLFADFASTFDRWIDDLRDNTFLTCISLHDDDENQYGRLSMWRAYAPKNGVALLIDSTPMLRTEDRIGIYSTPVFYWSDEKAKAHFDEMAKQLEKIFLKMSLKEWPGVKLTIIELLRVFALSIKHPGFAEEKEWRVYYRPSENQSKYITSCVESVGGIPQTIQKLQLVEEVDTSVRQLFKRVIIGPSEHQHHLASTFVEILSNAGVEQASSKVIASTIPLRNS